MGVEAFSLSIRQDQEDARLALSERDLDKEEDELVEDLWGNEPDPDARYDALRDREIWDA